MTDITILQASPLTTFVSEDLTSVLLPDVSSENDEMTKGDMFGILKPIQYIDTVGLKPVSNPCGLQKIADDNPNVPTSLNIDKTKNVGEIPILSELSSAGSRTYSVPIDVYPGMKGFQPELTISYDCNRGNSYLGKGWFISGLPIIYRAGKSVYYDGCTSGVKLDGSDSFLLDGMRMLTVSNVENNLYETELGNIMVRSHKQGETIIYFEVFYPDGNKGIFGFKDSVENKLYYPITSLTDLYGNEIKYSYTFSENLYHISEIFYNGASIVFSYDGQRKDPIHSYACGKQITEDKLLSIIECKLGTTALRSYNFSYIYQTDRSGNKCNALLSEIGYTCDNSSLNPLKFYYGTGNEDQTFSQSETLLSHGYSTDDSSKIRIVKGRFDYSSKNDGIIILPNIDPYYPKKGERCYDNKYSGNEQIFIYSCLSKDIEVPSCTLSTGSGFVNITCADLKGKNEEYIVKINNVIENKRDVIIFDVYASSAIQGLVKVYSRRFDTGYAYKYKNNEFTLAPKYFYTGDFNGDGKTEILSISAHLPFGGAVFSTRCMLFDIENNNVLYDGPIFPYFIDFNSIENSNEQEAVNNSDKVLMLDFDGDGKTDVCHIDGSGMSVFTFEMLDNSISPVEIKTYNNINKGYLQDKVILVGEFNGDGMMDILVSPSCKTESFNWDMHYSMGNGLFDQHTFKCIRRYESIKDGFISQDIDGDGKTDLIQYDSSGFTAFLTITDKPLSIASHRWDKYSNLIPANVNSHNKSIQLIGLNGGTVTKYSYPINKNTESLLTGMANSQGLIEKNDYILLDDPVASYFYYTKGSDAVFPYVNLLEPLPVVAVTTSYLNGEMLYRWSNSYSNAVFHSQGKGFCGFRRIYSLADDGRFITREFSPYAFGTIKSETTSEFENSYQYSISTQPNNVSKVALSSKMEKDLLKGISSNTTYVNDSYGFPTKELTVLSDNSSEEKIFTYHHNSGVADGYQLGFLKDKSTTLVRNGVSYTERVSVPAFSNRQPNLVLLQKNGNTVCQTVYVYDSHGLPLSITKKQFSSPHQLKTTFSYDSYGRTTSVKDPHGWTKTYSYDIKGLLKKFEDIRGGTTTFGYDAFGRLTEASYPDGIRRQIVYNWSESSDKGVYYTERTFTGTPDSTFCYDALNRLVQTGEKRFDGTVKYSEYIYDNLGNLVKSSQPARGDTPRMWNTFRHDAHGRLTKATYASGEIITWKYKGTSVTESNGRSSVTTQYDVRDNLVSVTDESGTVKYTYAPDDLLVSIDSPDNVTTSLEYDKYRRRIGMTDPSLGHSSWEYDASGNIVSRTDADGKTTQYTYDTFGRLTSRTSEEQATSYAYGTYGELLSVVSDNGTSSTFSYDSHGRVTESMETGVDGVWLKKSFLYDKGNIASVSYTSITGLLASEQRSYSNGFLSEITLNGSSSIFKLDSENDYGQPTSITTGGITRQYEYSDFGLPSRRKAFTSKKILQDFSYDFDNTSGNLKTRKDNSRNLFEAFEYDNLDRITGFNGEIVEYASNGNVTWKSDVGDFVYGLSDKPYAITGINAPVVDMPAATQDVSYASFSRPTVISEEGVSASISYNGNFDRVQMIVKKDGKTLIDRHYLGGCYELEKANLLYTERLYLAGDSYSSPAVVVKTSNPKNYGDILVPVLPEPKDSLVAALGLETGRPEVGSVYGKKTYFILRDYLGSITHVSSTNGTVSQELSYDAWGRLRDPDTLVPYAYGEEPTLVLRRGFTGHEHLQQFGLINMNARLYDPLLCRFLSPDPNVQAPFWMQNLNRYSYALNNPLCYIDEDGELIWAIIGAAAVIGGVVNVANHWDSIKSTGGWNGFWKGLGYFAISAGAGGIGAAVGVGAAVGFGSMLGVTAASLASATTGFIPGFIYGASTGLAEGLLLRTSNSLMEGNSFGNSLVNGLKGAAVDAVFGGLSGGVTGGVKASNQNLNILDGSEKKIYTGYFGFDDKNSVRYVGITGRDYNLRFKEHLHSNTERAKLFYFPEKQFNSLIKSRIWEQTQINIYGMKKFGGQLLNKRNEIAKKYWNKFGIKP